MSGFEGQIIDGDPRLKGGCNAFLVRLATGRINTGFQVQGGRWGGVSAICPPLLEVGVGVE